MVKAPARMLGDQAQELIAPWISDKLFFMFLGDIVQFGDADASQRLLDRLSSRFRDNLDVQKFIEWHIALRNLRIFPHFLSPGRRRNTLLAPYIFRAGKPVDPVEGLTFE